MTWPGYRGCACLGRGADSRMGLCNIVDTNG